MAIIKNTFLSIHGKMNFFLTGKFFCSASWILCSAPGSPGYALLNSPQINFWALHNFVHRNIDTPYNFLRYLKTPSCYPGPGLSKRPGTRPGLQDLKLPGTLSPTWQNRRYTTIVKLSPFLSPVGTWAVISRDIARSYA